MPPKLTKETLAPEAAQELERKTFKALPFTCYREASHSQQGFSSDITQRRHPANQRLGVPRNHVETAKKTTDWLSDSTQSK